MQGYKTDKKGRPLRVPVIARFLLQKLGQYIPTFIVLMTALFFLIHLAPGDPAQILAGEGASLEYIERVRVEMGLNEPLHVQLYVFLSKIFRGDLGYSFTYSRPVIRAISERIPATLLLMVTHFVFTTILGIYIGAFTSRNPYSWLSRATSLFSVSAYSVPIFWLGMMMILFFSLQLRLFPGLGMRTLGRSELTGIAFYADIAWHLFLPAMTMGIHQLALITRLTRASMLEELGQDYVRTARSKGIGERAVLLKHALKNALLPVITLVGMNAGRIVGGAVLTETVFSWPGIGLLTYDAISSRDYPLLMGTFVIISIGVFLGNLIADIVTFNADPRIRSV